MRKPRKRKVNPLKPMWRKASNRKYGNIRTALNGRMFDSKKEADHAGKLEAMRLSKDPKERVTHIEYQSSMPIIMNGIKVARYVADFVVTFQDGRKEIHDVKGMRTRIYSLKKKLIEAQYGEKILEF